ncbi:MAG: DUF4831 family protein [Paludibacteraceae bacterium]|nr:DUF4831 family protein [Paludibacteraceae bacterium]
MNKRFLSLITILSMGLGLSAQTIFRITYEEVTTQRGQFYQYSRRYLNTEDVATENTTTYRLLSIEPVETAEPIVETVIQPEKAEILAPLSEEALQSGSTQKMAEQVAKQIYRIREARINLLSGEVEHVPADGEAMLLVLNELDRQERLLTAEFIGSSTTVRHTTYVQVDTLADGRSILLRFSKIAGPVASDNLSGDPVLIDVECEYEQVLAAQQPKKDKEPRNYVNQLKSRKMIIIYNHKTIYEENTAR